MDIRECRQLVQLYGSKEFLWNIRSTNYRNKAMRQAAWKEISSKMKISISELKKKMTSLLACYRREKSRIAKSLASGKREVYVSKWYAFDDFSFMKDKDLPDEETSEAMLDISTSDTEVTPDNEATPENDDSDPDEPPLKKSKAADSTDKEVEDTDDVYRIPDAPKARNKKITTRTPTAGESPQTPKIANQIQLETSSPSPSTDSYFTYGQYIANELRKYDQRTLIYVKNAINNVIFEADLGHYTPSQAHVNSIAPPQQNHQHITPWAQSSPAHQGLQFSAGPWKPQS